MPSAQYASHHATATTSPYHIPPRLRNGGGDGRWRTERRAIEGIGVEYEFQRRHAGGSSVAQCRGRGEEKLGNWKECPGTPPPGGAGEGVAKQLQEGARGAASCACLSPASLITTAQHQLMTIPHRHRQTHRSHQHQQGHWLEGEQLLPWSWARPRCVTCTTMLMDLKGSSGRSPFHTSASARLCCSWVFQFLPLTWCLAGYLASTHPSASGTGCCA